MEDTDDHKLDSERFLIKQTEVDKINEAIKNKKKILTVGTTSTRVLEHSFSSNKVHSGKGKTDLFIHNRYQFKVVDTLLTNFHMPKSTPLMLTIAFGGTRLVKEAYNLAIANDFRFYSYGDAMLVL